MSEASVRATRATDALDEVVAHFQDAWRQVPVGVPPSAAAELTLGQLRLLFGLVHEGPASMGTIAEWLGCGLAAATGVIDRLERHGLVERRHRTDDRRVVEASVNERGRDLLLDIQGLRAERLGQLVGLLEPDERRDLDRLLVLMLERATGNAP
jgi:DNA-binding MarR family transcriptional regulator